MRCGHPGCLFDATRRPVLHGRCTSGAELVIGFQPHQVYCVSHLNLFCRDLVINHAALEARLNPMMPPDQKLVKNSFKLDIENIH